MSRVMLASLSLCALLAGCNAPPEVKKPAGPPATLVTVVKVQTAPFEVVEETVGSLIAVASPKISAEVAGRIDSVRVDTGSRVQRGQVLAVLDSTDATLQSRADRAELARVLALLTQQERLVERQAQLVQKGFISPNAAEDAIAQRNALREQADAARARSETSQRAQAKTQVVAPLAGVIDARNVSPGDYVKVGDTLFQLVAGGTLRAQLPFPESAQSRLQVGQKVDLTTPLVPGKVITSRISDIKPMVSEGARALSVLVDVPNDGTLRAGASVNAAVLIASRADALTVPEQSVVLRPAGRVVYVLDNNRARQRVVDIGAKRGGRMEILKGLQAGDTVVLDGAGFLTDGTPVQIKTPPSATSATSAASGTQLSPPAGTR